MSVLIKGMKMPKNCEECEFCNYGGNEDWCYITELSIPKNCITEENRQANCPLIELPQHGRLIDADALKAGYFVASTTTNSLCQMYVSLETIANAPTILEAEVEE